jgi:hypothetical protein
MTHLAEDYTLSILLQEMLSGYMNTSEAVVEGYRRIVDHIPNYQYHIEPDITPTPQQ